MSTDMDPKAHLPPTPQRVSVWACPEVPGPPLDRRDTTDEWRLRFASYGWTWWSARHVVLLPEGMSLLDALRHDGPVEVTVVADVDPLASGLNETHERYGWSERQREQRMLDPGDLCAVVEPDHHSDLFPLMRDVHRREHGLPRAVVRSDLYGQQPVYLLRHDWPVGTFMQGGRARTVVEAAAAEVADPQVRTVDGKKIVRAGVFIEAFPRDPATFLRGEGPDFAAAEDVLWAKWQRIVSCPGHEYETRGYTNGLGFCKHCNLSTSGAFDLAEIGSTCVVCGVGTNWSHVPRYDADGHPVKGREDHDKVCEAHAPPNQWDVIDALEAAEDGQGEPPDTTWFAAFLPAGVPVSEVDTRSLRDAVDRGRRAWVDRLVAERADTED